MIQAAVKRCSKCEETKAVTAFYASVSGNWCKECRRTYVRAWGRRRRGPNYIECRRCGRRLAKQGVRGMTAETGICAACRYACEKCGRRQYKRATHSTCWRCRGQQSPNGNAPKADRHEVMRRAKAGMRYQDIANELGCSKAAVGRAARPLRPIPAWKTRRIRWLVEQHGGDHIAAAVEAFRCADEHHQQQRDGTGIRNAYTDVTAENVVDAMTTDWKERAGLLAMVLRTAKEQG